eukprot:1141970-Pelagomonas_calceolata.AAC.9
MLPWPSDFPSTDTTSHYLSTSQYSARDEMQSTTWTYRACGTAVKQAVSAHYSVTLYAIGAPVGMYLSVAVCIHAACKAAASRA